MIACTIHSLSSQRTLSPISVPTSAMAKAQCESQAAGAADGGGEETATVITDVHSPKSPAAQPEAIASLASWAAALPTVLMCVCTTVDPPFTTATTEDSGTPATLETVATYAVVLKSSTATSKVELKEIIYVAPEGTFLRAAEVVRTWMRTGVVGSGLGKSKGEDEVGDGCVGEDEGMGEDGVCGGRWRWEL